MSFFFPKLVDSNEGGRRQSAAPDPTPGGNTPGSQGPSQSQGASSPGNLTGRDPNLIYIGEKIKLADGREHIVQSGETLTSIAAHYGVSVSSIIAANGMTAPGIEPGRDPNLIRAGESIKIKLADGREIEHVIDSGETLTSIADKYGVSVQSIIDLNKMQGANLQPSTPNPTAPGGVATQPAAAGTGGTGATGSGASATTLPTQAELTRMKDRFNDLKSLPNSPFQDSDRALIDKAIADPSSLTNEERDRIRMLSLFEKTNPQQVANSV
jgi:LysM repeat protein